MNRLTVNRLKTVQPEVRDSQTGCKEAMACYLEGTYFRFQTINRLKEKGWKRYMMHTVTIRKPDGLMLEPDKTD